MKIITMNSVKGGVGKSTTALILARELSQAKHPVYLVDMDLSCPALDSLLMVREYEFGFENILNSFIASDSATPEFENVFQPVNGIEKLYLSGLAGKAGELFRISNAFHTLEGADGIILSLMKAADFIETKHPDKSNKEPYLIVDLSPGMFDYAGGVMLSLNSVDGRGKGILISSSSLEDIKMTMKFLLWIKEDMKNPIYWLIFTNKLPTLEATKELVESKMLIIGHTPYEPCGTINLLSDEQNNLVRFIRSEDSLMEFLKG